MTTVGANFRGKDFGWAVNYSKIEKRRVELIPGDKKTLTIARRTRTNLEFFDKQKQTGAPVEEFTQLLNSLFSIIICLREDYFKDTSIDWEEVEKKGLKKVILTERTATSDSPKLKPTQNFSQLVNKMRHALAHNNFDFIEDDGQISGLKVWNVPSRQENKVENRIWEAELDETQIRELADLLIDYLEKTV